MANRWTRWVIRCVVGAAVIGVGHKGWALQPDEIVVLYNSMSPWSLEVAKYYVNARHIPAENIVPLRCGPSDWISESDYRHSVVPELQKGLADRHLTEKVKCLVTTFGLPLGISGWTPGLAMRQELVSYEKQLNIVLESLEQQIQAYNAIGTIAASPVGATSQPGNPNGVKRDLNAMLPRLQEAARDAVTRLKLMSVADQPVEMSRLATTMQRTTGLAGFVAGFQIHDDTPNADAARAGLNKMQAKLTELNACYSELARNSDDPDARQQMVTLQAESYGFVGEARQLQMNISILTPVETESSFDNELALGLANQGYARSHWLMNPDNLEFFPNRARMKDVPRTVMVCRLDGATAKQTTGMIDQTLAVEAKGLDGTCYLDARGLHDGSGYTVFDQDLRRAAAWLKENSTMPVVLDDRPELLQAKDCPNAALYCGWYSLKHYVDSCQWVQGAVGYHVASLEMTSLHNPKETGWVVNLLDRGFCGTLGAVSEPYLTAFPKPSLFFPLILSGQFTQGEVWQMTAPMVSWRVGYVGDPLYNPFKVKPRVTVESLKKDAVLANAFLEFPR